MDGYRVMPLMDAVKQSDDDNALAIGFGQTISQPYIVALMTDLLDLTPQCMVLEIGTGSGYQAAILSLLAKKVYTIERVSELYKKTDKLLKELGYNNIETRCCNGYHGWHEKASFDTIIVTAAATHIPPDQESADTTHHFGDLHNLADHYRFHVAGGSLVYQYLWQCQ